MRASSLRRRFPMLALTLSVAAAVVLGGPIGGVATAKTSHHHKVAPKILELGGTWTGSYSGKRYSGHFTLDLAADRDEVERIAEPVQPGRQLPRHRHGQRQQHPLRRRQRGRRLHRFGFEQGKVDVGQLGEPGGQRKLERHEELTRSRGQRRSLRSRRLRRLAPARAKCARSRAPVSGCALHSTDASLRVEVSPPGLVRCEHRSGGNDARGRGFSRGRRLDGARSGRMSGARCSAPAADVGSRRLQ